MITKLKYHENCDVQIVIGYNWRHYAHLECCDPKCKRKKRWIQWLNGDDLEFLKTLGVPVKDSPVVNIKGTLFDRRKIGI